MAAAAFSTDFANQRHAGLRQEDRGKRYADTGTNLSGQIPDWGSYRFDPL